MHRTGCALIHLKVLGESRVIITSANSSGRL
jgi:hypothetical protein